MWLDHEDLRQIRALAHLEGRHPRYAVLEAIRYAQRCRRAEAAIDPDTIPNEAGADDRPARMRAVIETMQAEAAPHGARLPTAIQAEALALLMTGHRQREVAEELGISCAAASQLIRRACNTAREVLNRRRAA